jgi:proton-translocating NADH-quinone oxidoreductase chain M
MLTSLNYLYLLPILGIIFIIIAPIRLTKYLALTFSIITFIYSIILSILYNPILSNQYIEMYSVFGKIFVVGLDGISLNFVLLTAFILPICVLVSYKNITTFIKEYYISLISIELILFGVFSIMDILGFYILYEAVLIPMFLIIGVWGARKEKITAAYYFFFYTFVGSIIMLISIIYLYNETGSTDYNVLLSQGISKETQNYIFLAFLASFAVKIPKFPFHIWLPLAHVEAPLAGSILLAAVLIKLGSYGFIRFALPLLPDACIYYAPLVNTMALLAIIYASITTIRQTDLKRIIAYSSIGHMGVIMLGIFSLTIEGVEGSIYLQIGHGLVSSALFIIVTVLYDRHHSRLVKYYRGMAITMPLFATMFLLFTMANIAVPLSCNFIGEFLSLYSIYTNNLFIGIVGGIGIILSACYALFLLNRVAFGSMSPYITENRDLSRREYYILLPLAILSVLLGVYPEWIYSKIHYSVLTLII